MTVRFEGQNGEHFAGESVQYFEEADRHFRQTTGRNRPISAGQGIRKMMFFLVLAPAAPFLTTAIEICTSTPLAREYGYTITDGTRKLSKFLNFPIRQLRGWCKIQRQSVQSCRNGPMPNP